MVDVGLYLHVAFCKTKCFYCDFNTYAGLGQLIDPYATALGEEIRRLPPALPDLPADASQPFRIGSIFFGGGTPSLLTTDQVEAVLNAARGWPFDPTSEITLEINPDDPSTDYFRRLRALGVNRVSLGVQCFDNATLRRLGRRHDAAAAVSAYERARAAGFDNVSLDLMFALPGQTLELWGETVDAALALAPDHLSLYNLTIEAETPFGVWSAAGKLTVPDDDAAADMYQLAIDRLGSRGYDHYEISNWARHDPTRDLRAQHNLRYWRNQPYFGVGAGAHSSFAGRRYANLLSPRTYINRIRDGEPTFENVEVIDRPLAMAETMLLGLRLSEGVESAAFRQRFGCSPDEAYASTLAELRDQGLITPDRDRICLTLRGRFVGNDVFYRFLPKSVH